LYWRLGDAVLQRQHSEGWGIRVIDRLATDLRGAFPDIRGLSRRNLVYMRTFATAYRGLVAQQLLRNQPWGDVTGPMSMSPCPYFVPCLLHQSFCGRAGPPWRTIAITRITPRATMATPRTRLAASFAFMASATPLEPMTVARARTEMRLAKAPP